MMLSVCLERCLFEEIVSASSAGSWHETGEESLVGTRPARVCLHELCLERKRRHMD